jgi:gamma-glutamyltranspeptidase/glutathione hydrolase
VFKAAQESHDTTQFSVVDKAGNAISNTYTINDWFGSRVTIPGAGFLLNDEMDDFTAKVGVPNLYGLLQSEANAIVPGKRPLSSMSPTIVSRNGKVILVTGSPGGSTIINTVLEIITNVIDHQMPVMQAVEYPRFHNQWMPDVLFYERYGMSPDTVAILSKMGYTLKVGTPWGAPYQGDGETIGVDWDKGVLLGACDPRFPDARALGY